MKASAITKKINSVATKYGPFETRTVYKRTVLESGGNTLIDRGVSQTVIDVKFVPQPLFKQATISPSSSPPSTSTRRGVLAGTSVLIPDDYDFLFTPQQMTSDDIASKYNIIVLKDGVGNEEQLEVITYKPLVLNGIEIGTNALYRSVSRGASTSPPSGGGNVVHYNFTPAPDGTTTTFTTTITVSANAIIFRNGIIMTAGSGNDYTYTGMTVTFAVAPLSADGIGLYQ